MTIKDTLNKAYGMMPREVGYAAEFDILGWRGIRYYWLKLKRKIQGRGKSS